MLTANQHPNYRIGVLMALCETLLTATRRAGAIRYKIRAYEAIEGRPVEELHHVVFWVGAGDDGADVGMVELVALFEFFTNRIAFERNLAQCHQIGLPLAAQCTARLKLDPSPETIANIFGQVRDQIEPPAPAPH